MSTTSTGRTAEALAADYLERQGFTILDRNWRNRWCELDLVARRPANLATGRPAIVHFVEVKYRATTRYGYASEYVSYDKTQRLMRAALAWTQAHSYAGPYQIDVIGVEGDLTAPAITHLANVTGQ